MAPHEAKPVMFADVGGRRRARRNRGEAEVGLLFVDAKRRTSTLDVTKMGSNWLNNSVNMDNMLD